MAKWNYAVLVFKKEGEGERDELDFARGVKELREHAHRLGFVDGDLLTAFNAALDGNYDKRYEAKEVDEVPE